ncbi:uncharacterized protein UV8b_00392 [Ustilaginoidea virens]|uniref:PH domain-containing protein n=1 Tax=Ustilaginoidea virens TaxID=1159556 RepID=A0A8E5HIN1_USTVR|nr:uncharacterized protein UV8b_00392 [Ustilaginoidea virens]QUC16151.1 hypothetical protein UV8b_00392 [Ustilaginoidea virens]
MDGLTIVDSRPWAKKVALAYIERHPVDTAPPVVRQESRVHQRATKKTPRKIEKAPTGSLPAPGTVSPPIRSSKPSKPSRAGQVVYSGICKLLHSKSRSLIYIVSLAMAIDEDNDEAFLILSVADKVIKVHNVLELSQPQASEDCCLVASEMTGEPFTYLLQFSSSSESTTFRLYLENLKRAVSRRKGAPSGGNGSAAANTDASKPVSDNSAAVTAQSFPGLIRPSPSAGDASIEDLNVNSTTSSMVPQASDAVSSTGAEVPRLVDVEPTPQPMGETKMATIEDAAEKLFDLIGKILPEANAAGMHLCEDEIADIEETAIDSWLTRGFLKSESDDMRSELLDLLRVLLRIKRKAESRSVAQKAGIKSLENFDKEGTKPRQIKYSVSEIVKLASNRAQDVRLSSKTAVFPPRKHATGDFSPTAALTGVSKHKARLSDRPESQQPCPPAVAPSQSTYRPRNDGQPLTRSSEEIGVGSASKSCTRPGAGGLCTSRWAHG